MAEVRFRGLISTMGESMGNLAIKLLIVAIIAAVLGFSGIAGTAAWLAKLAFFVYLGVAVWSFLAERKS